MYDSEKERETIKEFKNLSGTFMGKTDNHGVKIPFFFQIKKEKIFQIFICSSRKDMKY